jgi:hypothetical protein
MVSGGRAMEDEIDQLLSDAKDEQRMGLHAAIDHNRGERKFCVEAEY